MRLRFGRPDIGAFSSRFDTPTARADSPLTVTWLGVSTLLVDDGALYVGSPETVAARIAATVQLLGLERFELKYASGPMPHDRLMRSLELYGTRVIPRVRALIG